MTTNDTRSQKRAVREESILQAATQVLVLDGYPNFTLRKIADEAKMQLKSLQRIYPTKQQLLEAALAHILSRYYDRHLTPKIVKDSSKSAKEKFIAILDYILLDLRDPFTSALFVELWSIRDPEAINAVDAIYRVHIEVLAALIHEMNPTLPATTAQQRAVITAMSMEGLQLVLGPTRPARAEYDGIEDEFKARFLELATH